MGRTFTLKLNGGEYEIEERGSKILVNGKEFSPKVSRDTVEIEGSKHTVEVDGSLAYFDGIAYEIATEGLERREETAGSGTMGADDVDGALTAIMPGLIVRVPVKEGDRVSAGDVVVVLEAMKMENEICSPKDGVVKKVAVKAGDNVQQNQVLVVIE